MLMTMKVPRASKLSFWDMEIKALLGQRPNIRLGNIPLTLPGIIDLA